MTRLSPFPDGPPLRHRRRNSGGARHVALFALLLAVALPSLLAYSGPGIANEGIPSVSRQSRSDQAAAAIDSVYRRFSNAYRLLNADSVAVLYTEDALYLQPRGDMVRGRDRIRAIFADFFDRLKADGRETRIRFTSVDRRSDGALAYDIGYYELATTTGGVWSAPDRGKFATVWKRGDDGLWRIHVDSYSSAPREPDDGAN